MDYNSRRTAAASDRRKAAEMRLAAQNSTDEVLRQRLERLAERWEARAAKTEME